MGRMEGGSEGARAGTKQRGGVGGAERSAASSKPMAAGPESKILGLRCIAGVRRISAPPAPLVLALLLSLSSAGGAWALCSNRCCPCRDVEACHYLACIIVSPLSPWQVQSRSFKRSGGLIS